MLNGRCGGCDSGRRCQHTYQWPCDLHGGILVDAADEVVPSALMHLDAVTDARGHAVAAITAAVGLSAWSTNLHFAPFLQSRRRRIV